MVEALAVFRDTALEVEENNLREVAQTRQRLIDAIESISEGFAFYDADDRLQLCNTRYTELLYGGDDVDLEPGTPFEAIVRQAVERGLITEAGDDPERYIQRRLAQHRDPDLPTLQRRKDGRWVLISERRVGGGGTVAVYSDITTLKHRELELEEANQAIEHKHRELEALSSKLAKYLSPQVYLSIFSGKQEVSIASQRKKLTVFFSDITGFTETTDRLESEELTQLLNQYLTEMSRIALQHGATIDKYIGDGIMIFFRRSGEPRREGGCARLREDGDRDAKPCPGACLPVARCGDRAAACLPHRHQHRLLHGRQFRQRGPDGLHDHRQCREPRLAAGARGGTRQHPDLVRDPCAGQRRGPLRRAGADRGKGDALSGRDLRGHRAVRRPSR
jgi:class 3 adenylate cyclase